MKIIRRVKLARTLDGRVPGVDDPDWEFYAEQVETDEFPVWKVTMISNPVHEYSTDEFNRFFETVE